MCSFCDAAALNFEFIPGFLSCIVDILSPHQSFARRTYNWPMQVMRQLILPLIMFMNAMTSASHQRHLLEPKVSGKRANS